MRWEYIPYVLPVIIAAVTSAAIALYAWRRRSAPGARPFALLMLAVTEWSLGYVLELGSPNLSAKTFWSNVNFLGIAIVPIAWLAFALQYTGRGKWLTRRKLALLAIEPLVTLLLAWTNEAHGLFRSNVRLDTSGSCPMLAPTYSAGFWMFAAYSYLLILIGTFLLIQAFIRSPRLYRGQAGVLLIGALVPCLGNALHIFGLSPFPYLDLTLFAFTLTGLVLAWGLFHFRLLDIVPVARNAVVESMGDGVIVLDAQTRIVDLNPAAQRIIGRTAGEAIGQPAAQVLPGWPDGPTARLSGSTELGEASPKSDLTEALVERYRGVTEAHAEIILGEGATQQYSDLRVSPLHDRHGQLTGHLILLRDITERKRAEELLQKERETFYSILQKAPYGVLLIDMDERCLYINPEFTNITGHTLDVIPTVGDWFRKAYPDPTYRQRVIERWKGDTAQRISRVFSVVCKGGEVKEIEFRPTLLDDGRAILVLSDITERKRTEERLRIRERFLECLSEVSQQLLRTRDLTEVLPAVMRRLGKTAEVSRVYLFENHPGPKGELLGRQRYEWCAPGVEPQMDNPDLQNLPYTAGGFASWAEILKRGGVIAGAVADLPENERVGLESRNIRSILAIPLFISNQWYGFIGFDVCDRVREWQQIEVDLLRATASDIASTIEREQVERQSRALAEAAAALTATLDFEQVLDRILEQVSHVVPNDATNIILIEGDQARIARWRGYERFGAEEFVSTVVFHIPEVPSLQQMVDTGQPMVIPDTTTYPGWVRVPALEWLRSYASAPIVVRGQVIGFLSVDSTTPGFFTQAQIRPLRAFADHAAAAIENARLFQAEQRQMHRLTVLADVARIVATTLDADELLQAVAESVHRSFGYPAVMLFTPDEEAAMLVLRGYRGIPIGPPETTTPGVYRQSCEVGIIGQVARTGRPHIVSDVLTDPYFFSPGEAPIQSALCVPILDEGRVIGVIDVESDRLADFDGGDQSLLEAVADTVAIGLRNTRLYEEARLRADELAAALARQEELDHLKNEFIQNVSHELRTPLALIRGYAEMLNRGELGELQPAQRDPVTVITRRARMLSDLIQDITLVLETEASPPEPEPVLLGELTRVAVDDFQVAAEQAELTLHAEITPHLPPVNGSYTYLRRVLDNLLGNAAKFTLTGGTITVRVQQEGEQIALEVSDTGVGIPPDQLERIFERFYQVDGSARRRYGGIGLGLALVKETIETYGGHVTVESQVGRGSTFTVFLPIAADANAKGE